MDNHLYAINFVAGAESGIALVAAPNERSAIQVLRGSGKYNASPEKYSIQQARDIGMTPSCYFGLLMESYVNALQAFEAITSVANHITGPKGDTGDVGPEGKQGIQGEPGKDGVSVASVEQTRTATEDSGYNEITFTLDNGITSKAYIKNGRAGVVSASASVDNSQGTPSVVTYLESGVLSLAFSGLKGLQGNPGVNNATMQVVSSLPSFPGEETTQKIYLMYNSETGEYDRYFTQFDGYNYSWVKAGSLSIDMEDYQRKDDEIWLTQEEFDALETKDITKVYNIYEESDRP